MAPTGTASRRGQGPGAVLLWFVYALNCTLLALCLCWGSLSWVDYGYPVWYRVLHIGDHIDEYAPQNRHHKLGLEALSPQQHQALFHRIVVAVHDHGNGLARISYENRHGAPVPLLRAAEVQHLQDVAGFLDHGRWLMLALAVLWWPLARAVRTAGQPRTRQRVLVAGMPLAAVVAWLLVAGPEAVFYRFHIWLFPADHEWFFYWQDSLMSTLMKAPDLFGAIAIVLAGATLLMTPLLYRGGLRLAGGPSQRK